MLPETRAGEARHCSSLGFQPQAGDAGPSFPPSRLHRHVFRVLDVLAAFRVADVLRAGLLGDLFQKELGAALGAVLVHRLLPQRALAVRVAAAGPERLAPPRALLHHLAFAALEAGHARGLRRLRLRPGLAEVLALRITRAAVERAEAAPLQRHRPAALLAGRDLLLGAPPGTSRAVAVGGRSCRRGLLQVPGVVAIRIGAAGHEGAEAAEADAQRRAARRAELVHG